MAVKTKIEWTDSTFNPWIGCQKVSPGCDHCYAEQWAERYGHVKWGPGQERHRTSHAYWRKPLGWRDIDGRRHRVFCASLADVFDNQVPPSWRADLWDLIRVTKHLDWLLLTKRPQNIAKMLPADWGEGWGQVWLGTTAEDAERYRQRWPHLARIKARVRFISYEPAIGPLGPLRLPGIEQIPDWVIDGGESGPQARMMKGDWSRQARDDCGLEGVAYFKKQWGSWPSNPLVAEQRLPLREAQALDPHGKGGELLDGQLHRAFPLPRAA